MASISLGEDALTSRLRGVLNKAAQVESSIGSLEREHKTPTDVLDKLSVLAGKEVKHLLREINPSTNPILQHYVACPSTNSAMVAALLPILLRTKPEPEIEDEDHAAEELFEASLRNEDGTPATAAQRQAALRTAALAHVTKVEDVLTVVREKLEEVHTEWRSAQDDVGESTTAPARDTDVHGRPSHGAPLEDQAAAAFVMLYGGL